MGVPYAEVIGDPIAHSKSPAIHKFWLEKLGLGGDYRSCRVTKGDLSAYLESRRSDPDWRGCNLTAPLKEVAADILAEADETGAMIGAVNAILRADGRLLGHNTDVAGFLDPLRPVLAAAPARRSALVIGAGGAARAIAFGLAGQGFNPLVLNRDPERARLLTAQSGGPWFEDLDIYDLAANRDLLLSDDPRFEKSLLLVVNASNLGMTGFPPLDVTLAGVDRHAIVYDIVYSPLETALLAAARRRGMPTIDGLAMLIGQAARAFELFFGGAAPREHDLQLRELLSQ